MIFVVVRIQNRILCIHLKAGNYSQSIRNREYKRGIKQFARVIVTRVPVFCRAVGDFLKRAVMRMRSDKCRFGCKTVRTCVLQNE